MVGGRACPAGEGRRLEQPPPLGVDYADELQAVAFVLLELGKEDWTADAYVLRAMLARLWLRKMLERRLVTNPVFVQSVQ